MKDDPRKVVARVRLSADTPVKTDTRAKLALTGLTGVAIIQLTGGSPGSPALEPREGQRVALIPSEPSALQNIADTANRLVARMDQLLSEENINRISDTLENLEQATGSIAGQRKDIAALIVNAREVTDGLKLTVGKANGAIDGVDRNFIARLPALMDKLDATVAKLDSAAGNADALITENRPAVNSFANDGLAQLGPTLAELRRLIRDLRNLSDRLEDKPASYILGRDAPKEFEPK
jgi:phospholipid/cholesterol/gamma-HCH transport system substrate-binding protein